jgi:hypothetical protein
MEPIPQADLTDTPFAGLTVYRLEESDEAPDDAVCKTATQFLDQDAQPIGPPKQMIG